MRGRTAHRSNAFSRYEKANREQMNKVSSILGLRLHGTNYGQDVDDVSSVFQRVSGFDNCNIKVVIYVLRTALICKLPNYSVTFFEENKFLLLASEVI